MDSFKVILIGLFLSALSEICVVKANGKAAPNPRLIFLGTLGNKQFYYNPEPSTWDEAVKLCGLNDRTMLVKIESKTERLFLSNVLNAIDENYWTAGRDIATGYQFGWFGNGGDNVGLVGEESEWYDGKPIHRSCVIYNPYTEVLFNYLCTDKLKAICQYEF